MEGLQGGFMFVSQVREVCRTLQLFYCVGNVFSPRQGRIDGDSRLLQVILFVSLSLVDLMGRYTSVICEQSDSWRYLVNDVDVEEKDAGS